MVSLVTMVACGLKNPGRLRSSKGREMSLERLTQHMKNMSTSSLDGMIEQTSQVHIEPKIDLKPTVQESSDNPYARIEVELGSDSFRASRLAEDQSKPQPSSDAPPELTQQPAAPVKSESPAPAPLIPEAKQFPEPASTPFTRFCPVCSVDQLLRSKHCNVCQMCIATYDHHCPWLGTCIGEKNRLLFLGFLTVFLMEIGLGFGHSIGESLKTWGEYGILCVFSGVGFMLTLLYVHHLFLIWRNLTTWEFLAKSRITYLKDWPSRWQSPFNKGFLSTLKTYLTASSNRTPFIRWQLPEDPPAIPV